MARGHRGCQSTESGRGYARYYGFTLAEQAEVTITVNSDEDSYLYLRSGDARSGTALNDHQGDDDAGGDRNAQIVETLEAGDYTIEATTFDAATAGTFTLTISGLGGTTTGPDPGPGPGTDVCGEAITHRRNHRWHVGIGLPVHGVGPGVCEVLRVHAGGAGGSHHHGEFRRGLLPVPEERGRPVWDGPERPPGRR